MDKIKINTELLVDYSHRINAVNKRLLQLDRRIDKLYFKVGLVGLLNLISADLFVGYSWKLVRIEKYLRDTALDFERIENELKSKNPVEFNFGYFKHSSLTQKSVIPFSLIPFIKTYNEFNKSFDSSHLVPGLQNGFVPQGVVYDKDSGLLYISGCYEDELSGKASRLIVIDEKTGAFVKSVRLQDVDGSDFSEKNKAHAGGITYIDGKIYVTCNSGAYILSKSDLLNAQDDDILRFDKKVKLETKGSYATTSKDYFYSGNFVKNDSKSTTTLDNGMIIDKPLCEGRKINNGSISDAPDYYIATPKQVQGMAVTKSDKFIFSTSSGRTNPSKIYTYDNILETEPIGTITKNGKTIPVYSVDNANCEKVVDAPPLSEGVCTAEDKMYLLFESGATKYRDSAKDPVDTLYVASNY